VALGILSVQAPYLVGWTIRSALLLSGFIVGIFAVSLGFIFGRKCNALLTYLGSTAVFALSFILGTAMVPFTGKEEIVFISQAVFFSNSLCFTGILAYIIGDKECFISRVVAASLARA
jgi:hypothetical protein